MKQSAYFFLQVFGGSCLLADKLLYVTVFFPVTELIFDFVL